MVNSILDTARCVKFISSTPSQFSDYKKRLKIVCTIATNIFNFASIFLKIVSSTQNAFLQVFCPLILESITKLNLWQMLRFVLLSRVLDHREQSEVTQDKVRTVRECSITSMLCSSRNSVTQHALWGDMLS